jgi:hypothetical protein
MRPSLFWGIYLVVGLFVASNHAYLNDVDTIRETLSAILGVLLWPLVLLDVNLHIR